MKAAQLTRYTKDYKLELRNVDMPHPNHLQVLVKVKEAAVNPLDSLIGTGSLRLIQNYQLPQTMGNELTGEIVEIGKDVKSFNVNDKVYARLPISDIGAFAEYVAINADAVALMPETLDFKTGAAASLTGLTAYQALHEILNAHAGQTLFIPGGSGSFGQMAIPIAKQMGLTVFVNGGAEARERTLNAGADKYFDFKTVNYWEKLSDIDLVIDTLGQNELAHELSILKRGGQLLSLRMGPNGSFAEEQQMPTWKKLLFKANGRKMDRLAKQHGVTYHFIFVRSDGKQLQRLSTLIDQNTIVPAVDPTIFTIEQVNEAQNYLRNGRPKGKVLIHFN